MAGGFGLRDFKRLQPAAYAAAALVLDCVYRGSAFARPARLFALFLKRGQLRPADSLAEEQGSSTKGTVHVFQKPPFGTKRRLNPKFAAGSRRHSADARFFWTVARNLLSCGRLVEAMIIMQWILAAKVVVIRWQFGRLFFPRNTALDMGIRCPNSNCIYLALVRG